MMYKQHLCTDMKKSNKIAVIIYYVIGNIPTEKNLLKNVKENGIIF